MAATKEFIVAIELGSSKITGIAGRKNLDGSISVLAVVKEDATQCIRKGVVYNIDKTAQCLTNIISKLKNQLKSEIAHVYVGIGGQSIRSIRNVVNRDLPADTIITNNMINQLMDDNRNMDYPEQEILDAVTQEYKVDNQAGIAIAELFLAPLALAESVLTEAESRGGCLLVDLGADTTTVTVFHKNVLRHLAVIPLGGNNITRDIASLQIEEHDAEKMKLRYGCAYTDNSDIDNTLNYPIDEERSVESRKFIDIVEARLNEIIENVWHQVPSEYVDKLLGGIILTGGGCNMKNLERAFRLHTHIDKIRIAKFVNQTITSSNPDVNAHNGTMNTVLGLLAKGDDNCSGGPLHQDRDIFDTQGQPTPPTTADLHAAARPTNEVAGKGIVLTAAEKEKAEAERRRREEEEARREEEEAELLRKEEEERRKNSFWSKAMRNIRKFGNTIMDPEDE